MEVRIPHRVVALAVLALLCIPQVSVADTTYGFSTYGSGLYGGLATPDTTDPSVSLTAPADGATVSGTVDLTATAADNASVAGVSFYADGSLIGSEDTGSPYEASLNSSALTNATHTLVAVARDSSNNYATSTAVTVTVSNGGSGGSSGGGSSSGTAAPTSPAASPATNVSQAVTNLILANRNLFLLAQQQGIALPAFILNTLGLAAGSGAFTRDLTLSAAGEDVRTLQSYLNRQGYPVAATGAGSVGSETTFFGPATRAALIRFQSINGILPAEGYFGPKTRAFIATHP